MPDDIDTRQENNIGNELFDVQWDVIHNLDVLISAEWDAPQVKIKLARLLKQHYTLCDELDLARDGNSHEN